MVWGHVKGKFEVPRMHKNIQLVGPYTRVVVPEGGAAQVRISAILGSNPNGDGRRPHIECYGRAKTVILFPVRPGATEMRLGDELQQLGFNHTVCNGEVVLDPVIVAPFQRLGIRNVMLPIDHHAVGAVVLATIPAA